MNSLIPTVSSHKQLRRSLFMFAIVLACQATWLMTAEFFLSSSADTSERPRVAAAKHNASALAASFGFVRGDLWAASALAYSDILLEDQRTIAQSGALIERAREVADRALGLAPYDARIWLLIARFDARFDWLNGKSSAELRMSYYVGANEFELIPSRLPLAVNSSEIGVRDFQQLVNHDVRIIVTRKRELTPAILTAYASASPIGQQFLEDALKEFDPDFLSKLPPKK